MTNYFNEQIADLVRKRDQAYTIYKIVSDAHQVNVHDLNTKRRGVTLAKHLLKSRIALYCAFSQLGYTRKDISNITGRDTTTINRGWRLHRDMLKDEDYKSKWAQIVASLDALETL